MRASIDHEARWPSVAQSIARAAAMVRADLTLAIIDALLVCTAFIAVLMLRFDGSVPDRYWVQFLRFLPAVLVVTVGFNAIFGLYSRLWRHASVQEAGALLGAGAVSGGGVILMNELFGRALPLSVAALGPFVATFLIGTARFQSRLLYSWRQGEREGQRVLVIGTGDAGASLAHEMLRSPGVGLVPVVFLDEDRSRHGRRTMGIPVEGGIDDLEEVVHRLGIDEVVFAVTSASGETVRRAVEAAERADVAMRVVPGISETLVNGAPSLRDLRKVRIEDLIGREQVPIDLDAVRTMIGGRRVLVTGAGGSIGSEIVRQVAAFGPAALVALDRDETLLHDLSTGLGFDVSPALVDIRNRRALAAVFDECRPEIVFHAAALKHVPILEQHVTEAVATNVVGTSNVASEARRCDVEHFVLISTDKAVDPVSVMGASKRVAEQIVLSDPRPERPWCAVRFGNVLGSRGSVVPTFMRQIEEGGPVTVTDERMTRFFMSTREAVQLVLQAAVLSAGGEVFALDMGEPVRILDLAERMIRLAGRRVGTDVRIDIVGTRPGERLDEHVWLAREGPEPTAHPSIFRVRDAVVASSDGRFDVGLANVAGLASFRDRQDLLRRALFDLVGVLDGSVVEVGSEASDVGIDLAFDEPFEAGPARRAQAEMP